MRENKTRFIILGMLNHESMTGYEIKKRIELTISHFWKISYGQLYPALKQLADEKLVTMQPSPSAKGPSKKVYTITDAGRQILRQWLLEPVEKESNKYDLMVKLFFGSQLPLVHARELITNFKTRYQMMLPTIRQFEQELRAILDQNHDHVYYLLTVLFGIKIYTAYIEWADEALALLH